MITDNTTFINPIGAAFILLMCVLIVVLPRKYALVPFILVICFMTMGQRVLVVGLNFTMFRILVFFGWIRLLIRGEIRGLKWHPIDTAVVLYVISNATIYTLQWRTWEAFVNRSGLFYNAFGLYFLFRFLLHDLEDVRRGIRQLATFAVPLAISMMVEKLTERNAFAVFGAVPLFTVVREGVLRCQGPFAHPILAGTFGATIFPFFAAMFRDKGRKLLAMAGMLSSLVIVGTAGSSGPVMALLFGVLALVMWPMRDYLRAVRWGLLISLVGLHLVMKAPVWFLIGRITVFSGNTGWHRSYLIDQAIAHFWEWWLLGTRDTAHWGRLLSDVTNQYINEGADAGFLTMVLFILIIVRCFRTVGVSVRAMQDGSFASRFQVWGLGASLLAHAVTFISVSYFDQNILIWYLLLAMISTVGVAAQASEVPLKELATAPAKGPLRLTWNRAPAHKAPLASEAEQPQGRPVTGALLPRPQSQRRTP